MHQFVSHLNS